MDSIQDIDIAARWDEVFSIDKYRTRLMEVQDKFPQERSVFVNFNDIDLIDGLFAENLLRRPDECLEIGKDVIKRSISVDWDLGENINIRIIGLPKDVHVDIRNIRHEHLRKLISIDGLVKKTTLPKPRIIKALFQCSKCGSKIWQVQKRMQITEPSACTNEKCKQSAPKFVLDEISSIYSDTQKIEIQENPEGLEGGKQPERISCIIDDDISGRVTPGDRVTVNGIVRPAEKVSDKFTTFDLFFDVNSLESEQHEFDEVKLTDSDVKNIKKMAADPNFFENLTESIAPTVYGMIEEKQGVALQLFGGTRKEMDDGSILRGDIHILMVGDPGVAKSQILNYMSHLAPRGIYASGKSSSAAGLCVDASTSIINDQGQVESIGNFVNSVMVNPEEYKPGIWRQAIDNVKIQSFTEFGVRYVTVSHVWKIKTPKKLYKIVAGPTSLILTPETKIQAMHGIRFDWIEAKNLNVGDMAAIVSDNMRFIPISEIETITDNLPNYVYDLTLKAVHAFIGNGFVIHNTAAAVKDEFGGGGWTLEAGALVLADKGLACIDELDKMSAQDRSSLHEAMESQRVSVAKAGINATLQSRCSLLAAANPKFGRFDTRERIVSQINIPPALMSRFDLIFVKYDHPDSDNDRNITEHILKTHMRGQARTLKNKAQDERCDKILRITDLVRPIYSSDSIRKYVSYAKRNYFPILSERARDMIEKAYLSMRKMGENIERSVPITARQLEAYIRLSEASAKSRLSNTVEEIDAQRAIHLVKYYMDSILKSDDSYDVDNLSQFNHRQRKSIMSANNAVKQILKENEGRAFTVDELINICKGELSRSEIEKAVEWLNENGYIFEPNPGKFIYI